MYEIILRNPAKKFLKRLNKGIREDILKKIEKLGDNPWIGKPLVGNLRGLWRIKQL